MAKPSNHITITPVLPKGSPITAILDGTAAFAPSSNGASGGLQVVDRPRQKAIVQWYDASPLQLTMKIILDGGNVTRNGAVPGRGGIIPPTGWLEPRSVETQCAQVLGWYYPRAGKQQPPVLGITGPIPHEATLLNWMLQSFSFDDAIRNPNTGQRTQQMISLTFMEFTPSAQAIRLLLSPAQVAQQKLVAKAKSTGRSIYVVKSGDNLQTIAARVLGNYSLWTNIAKLNGIRDPRSIRVGQRLILP